jgi:SAM-dependent methyltransferase/Flp pilus assembly protein TadD
MTLRSSALQQRPSAACPKYHRARNARDCHAVFSSGKQLPVDAGRARTYPGLVGIAPRTESFYEALSVLDPAARVLDLGSGSGQGCAILSQHFARVTGVDWDPVAVTFAREYATNVDFQARDIAEPWLEPSADIVTLIDVLAHVQNPELVLEAARSALVPSGRLVVAEPRARVGGRMACPQRRGFSEGGLYGLMIRAGFTQVRPLATSAGFVLLIGEVAAEGSGEGQLARAIELAHRFEMDAASEAFLRCVEGEVQVAHEARLALAELAALLVEARDSQPEDPRVWTALGRLALQARDAATAVQCAVEALEREPCEAPAALLLAESLQAMEHPQASEAWSVASRLMPADVGIATRVARICSAENDYETGIAALRRAQQYAPVDVDFRVVLGWLLLLAQRVDEALREAREAWAMDPSSVAALELLHAVTEVVPGSRIEA